MQEDVTRLTAAEEDPMVDGWLNSLPELSPGDDFEDRVMARVRVPEPRWVQSLQGATRALFSRRRVWVWTGGLATASAASLAVIISLVVSHWMQVETAWSVMVNGFALDAWRTVVAFVAQSVVTISAIGTAWNVTGSTVLYAALAAAAVTVGSAWGLYRVFTSFNTERIALHASR
jgi:hypothetical protein